MSAEMNKEVGRVVWKGKEWVRVRLAGNMAAHAEIMSIPSDMRRHEPVESYMTYQMRPGKVCGRYNWPNNGPSPIWVDPEWWQHVVDARGSEEGRNNRVTSAQASGGSESC